MRKSSEDDLVRTCSEHGIIVPKSKSLDSNIRGNENLLNEIIEKMGKMQKILQLNWVLCEMNLFLQ